ncbi:MAG: hypothetical protein HUJ60_04705 [Bacilli bacterium]|nr:hypothetical protein [Bacilli bacterium]
MKELQRFLKNHRLLCFYDLEGTQMSHEIIEIGAYKVLLKDDFTIKKVFRPYKAYVRPKHRIGHVVTKLTGIDEKLLEKKAIPFREMQAELSKYIGKDFANCLFIAYGSQDGAMFLASAENNMDASMEMARTVMKHTVDFSSLLRNYVQGTDGNPLSLTKSCEIFGIEFSGTAHDALADAKNLLELYRAFVTDYDTVAAQYKKVLEKSAHIPAPARKLFAALGEGKTVTPADYDAIVKECLQ